MMNTKEGNKMILVIQTQDYENYAAHTGFDGSFRWKAKGGSEVKVINIPSDASYDEIVSMVRGDIEQRNDYFITEIIGYGPEADDYLSGFEQSQLDYEGSITYKEPVIDYREIIARTSPFFEARFTDPMQYAEQAADADAVYYGA